MKHTLNRLYNQYNRRQFVHPDPLEFLYRYDEIRDREIAGFIASALAYGKVAQILKSVSCVLDLMGNSPHAFLLSSTQSQINANFESFVHRFANGAHLSALLTGIKQIILEYGSLYQCFQDGYNASDETVIPALTVFSKKIIAKSGIHCPGHLLPCPDKGSACKRLHLYLRWMIRKDDVDPGGWTGIPPSKLIVPLDTHMFQISKKMGLTLRNQANLKTAVEITSGFRKWSCSDPVRFDFALTRFGIRDDLDGHAALVSRLGI